MFVNEKDPSEMRTFVKQNIHADIKKTSHIIHDSARHNARATP